MRDMWYTYIIMSMCTNSNLSIILHGRKCMKLFHWIPHKTWRRDGRTGSIPCGHWKDAGTFPPPNAKELGMCVRMNWYPPALSISLDSEEGDGRVQWRGLEYHVRCGTCGVLWGVGLHVGHGKVNSDCNCFDNSETITASMAMKWRTHDNLSVMQYFLDKSTSVVKESVPVCIETAARGFDLD